MEVSPKNPGTSASQMDLAEMSDSDHSEMESQVGEAKPWPYLDDYFKFVEAWRGTDKKCVNVSFRCRLCPAGKDLCKTGSSSMGSLKRHLRSAHLSNRNSKRDKANKRLKPPPVEPGDGLLALH